MTDHKFRSVRRTALTCVMLLTHGWLMQRRSPLKSAVSEVGYTSPTENMWYPSSALQKCASPLRCPSIISSSERSLSTGPWPSLH